MQSWHFLLVLATHCSYCNEPLLQHPGTWPTARGFWDLTEVFHQTATVPSPDIQTAVSFGATHSVNPTRGD